jgi:hypothetical protein
MIKTGFESRVKIQQIISNQLPEFILDESPKASEFLKQYYISQEYQGGPVDIAENLDQYLKLDNLTPEVVVGNIGLSTNISSTVGVITVTSTKGFPQKYGLLKINDEIITNTFIFFLNKPYIIYYNLGDVNNNNYGNLIIKLNLCINCTIGNNNINNIIWNNDSIIIEKNISLFQFMNGIDINFILNNDELVINNWVPYKNGLLIDINNTLLNNKYIFKLLLLLNINFINSKENLDILNKYFS